MSRPTSIRKNPCSKEDVRRELARDWFATADRLGKGRLQDATGAKCVDTIDNVITGRREGLPELHTALNSLLADPAALFNTLMLFGVVAVPSEPGDCDDMAAISGMLRAATEYFERMKDGVRDHQDTLALADLFRPLVTAMLCVIREAGELRK